MPITKDELTKLSANLNNPIVEIETANKNKKEAEEVFLRVKEKIDNIRDIQKELDLEIKTNDQETERLNKLVKKQKNIDAEITEAKEKLKDKAKELLIAHAILGSDYDEKLLVRTNLKPPIIYYQDTTMLLPVTAGKFIYNKLKNAGTEEDRVYIKLEDTIENLEHQKVNKDSDRPLLSDGQIARKKQRTEQEIAQLNKEYAKLEKQLADKEKLKNEKAANETQLGLLKTQNTAFTQQKEDCKALIELIADPTTHTPAMDAALDNLGFGININTIKALYTEDVTITTPLHNIDAIAKFIDDQNKTIALKKPEVHVAMKPLRGATHDYRKESVQPKFDEIAKAQAAVDEVDRKIRAAKQDHKNLLSEIPKYAHGKVTGKTTNKETSKAEHLQSIANSYLEKAIKDENSDAAKRAKTILENSFASNKSITVYYNTEEKKLKTQIADAEKEITRLNGVNPKPANLDASLKLQTDKKEKAQKQITTLQNEKKFNLENLAKLKEKIDASHEEIIKLSKEKAQKEEVVNNIKETQKQAETDVIKAKELLQKADELAAPALPDSKFREITDQLKNYNNRYETLLNDFLYKTTEAKYNRYIHNQQNESTTRTQTENMLARFYSMRENYSQLAAAAEAKGDMKEKKKYEDSIYSLETNYISIAKKVLKNLDEVTEGIAYIRFYGTAKAKADIADNTTAADTKLNEALGIPQPPNQPDVIAALTSESGKASNNPLYTTTVEDLTVKCRWGTDEIAVAKTDGTTINNAKIGWMQFVASGVETTTVRIADPTQFQDLARYSSMVTGKQVDMPPKAIMEWALNMVNTHLAEFPNAKSIKITGSDYNQYPEHGVEALILAIKSHELQVELSPKFTDNTKPEQIVAFMTEFKPGRGLSNTLEKIEKGEELKNPHVREAVVFNKTAHEDVAKAILADDSIDKVRNQP